MDLLATLSHAQRVDIYTSFGLIAVVFTIRWLVGRMLLRRKGQLGAPERRLIGYTHSFAVLLSLFGLAFIWSPQLGAFALSITAFAAAIAIALKELILCMAGALWRTIVRPFNTGDWVDIGGRHGEILAMNFLSTHLAEINGDDYSYTGRTLILPNSLFFGQSIRNESFLSRFRWHHISLTLEWGIDPRPIAQALITDLSQKVSRFIEEAEHYLNNQRRKGGIDLPAAAPSTSLTTSREGRPIIHLSYYAPADQLDALSEEAHALFFDLALKARAQNLSSPQLAAGQTAIKPDSNEASDAS